MNFTIDHDIGASREAVVSALMDPSYYAYLGSKVSNIYPPELLVAQERGERCIIEVRYAFAGTLSGPARMAVDPEKLTWVIRTELHRHSGIGQLTMTPDHYGGLLSCSGSISIEEKGDGCLESLQGELVVHLPLVGKSAEVAKEYIKRGGQVMVIGRPRVELFKRRDSTMGAMCHITVDRFVLLGSTNGDGRQDVPSSPLPADIPASSQFTDDDVPL